MQISAIINEIERFAAPSLQEHWDNTGLQVGDPRIECTGVLICFDVTPPVVQEAIERGCNLIVSHHPLFFKPIRRLTASTPQQTCAMMAVAEGICIYSSHTAVDSAEGGVSYRLARLLGVEPRGVLSPLADRMVHLRVIVPRTHAEQVRDALFDVGAGAIGHYDSCSFATKGAGTFRPLEGADPYIGHVGELHHADETALDMVVGAGDVARVEATLLEVHPYEMPAYTFTPMLNRMRGVGLGVYGTTDEGLTPRQFVERVKQALGVPVVRTTALPDDPDMRIRRVSVCGGAGAEFINEAISRGSQVYVTADLKYHDFVDNTGRILLIDAGHYETEVAVKDIFKEVINTRFPDFKAVYCTQTKDNPINYI